MALLDIVGKPTTPKKPKQNIEGKYRINDTVYTVQRKGKGISLYALDRKGYCVFGGALVERSIDYLKRVEAIKL